MLKNCITNNINSNLICMIYHKINDKLHKKVIQKILCNKISNKIFYVNTLGYTNNVLVEQNIKMFNMSTQKLNLWEPLYKNVSGMISPNKIFIDKNYLIKVILNFNLCMFSGKSLKTLQDIVERLGIFLQQNTHISSSLYYTLAQHLIVNVLPYFNFSVDNLKQITDNQISYKYYENQPIKALNLIEGIVFKYTLAPFIKANENKIRIIAQNPDNLMSNTALLKQISEKQLKQAYGDFVGFVPKDGQFILDTINNKIILFDVKLHSFFLEQYPLLKGFLSLSTELTPKSQFNLDIRFIGDIKTSLNQKGYNIHTKKILMDAYNDGIKIINNKTITISEKLLRVENLRNNLDLNPNLRDFVCSRISSTPYDMFIEKFFKDHVSEMEHIITLQGYTLDLEKLFPQEQTANVGAWQNVILDFIEFFPADIKENMLENYHKFKLLEHESF